MKKLKLFSTKTKAYQSISHGMRFVSTLLLLLCIGVGNVWGEDSVYKTALFGSDYNANNSSYTGSFDATNGAFVVTVANFNNNNNGWSGQIKCGRKNNTSVASISTKAAIDKVVTKVSVKIESITASKVNSIKLYRSTNGSDWTEESGFTAATGAQEASVAANNQAANLYYKVEFDCASGTANGFVAISKVEYYVSGSQETGDLESIAISGEPTTTTYGIGKAFDPTGLVVTGTYSVGDPATISNGITWTACKTENGTYVALDNAAAKLADGETEIYVKATVNSITSPAFHITGLTVMPISTLIFTAACSGSGTADDNVSWTVTSDGTESTYEADKGIHYGTGSAAVQYIKLTTSGIAGTIKKVVVNASAASEVSATAAVTVGGSAFGGDAQSVTTSAAEYTFTGSASGAIEVTITKPSSATKALYCKSIVVYYEATPEVRVNPTSLDFTAKQNVAVDGKTFKLIGANLSADLTLAASTGFTVSPTSITAANAMADSVVVTVTPATPTTTTTPVEGTVTISGGGLASNVTVDLSMTVTETYAVALAVNDNAMGSATMNGGTATIYVTDDEEIALVATPESRHEFVNWTVSDENIIIDDENAASTTALAGAAGTITANFQAQSCTSLAAPTLDEVTKTYNSATIAWNAVTNASEGYEVYVYNDSEKTSTKASDLVTDGTSFAVNNLDANTTYYYTVMAMGDGSSYCDENNPLLEGNFTTNDYPAATLSLVENGGTPYNLAGSHKLNDVVTLPDELTGLGCTGKVLVGWSSVAVEETDDEPTSNYWAAGAEYTLSATTQTLYAVLATQTGGGVSNVEFNANTYATANNWENGTAYTEFTISGITFTASGGGNNGKYYTSDNSWRLYNGGSLSISGTGITGVSSTPSVNFTSNNGTYSVSFSATTQFTSIVVSVSAPATYEGYTTSWKDQLAAPTFSVEEGTYYEVKSVTLSATNEAAIYYTLDGEAPTTSSTKYTEAISLSERDEYTIKAIAVKSGFDNSEVAEAVYTINLPYDFADFAALTQENGKEYAVRGIISQKGTLTSGNQLPYYISANGQTEGQIKCHNGLKLNKANFTSADDVNLGDNVTVVGTWSTQYSNLNAGNWMLEYTARVHDAYVIEGDLTASSFDDGDAFDATILANLTVKETFTNGYYETVAGVTFNVGEKTAWADGDTKLTVNALLNEETIATKDFDVTVSSAVLESIALKADDNDYQTKVVYYIGETFVAPTIIATLDDESTFPAIATYVSGFDNENTGVQEVTVSYTRGDITKQVSYNITMKPVFNNEDAPHTVAVAKALIEARNNNDESGTDEFMWVRGIVSQANNASSNKQNYYISDNGETANQLYVYQGQYFSTNANFTTTNQLRKDDEVIVKARVQLYQKNGTTTPELKYSNVVSQLRDPEFEIADIVASDEFEAGFSEDLTVEPSANSGDAAFTLSSSNEGAVRIVDGKLHAVAEGDAVITATRAATANANALNYKEKTITFNVHVIAAKTRYAITFDANGGEGADPVLAAQLEGATVELPDNTYSKANSAFAAWVVNETVSGNAVAVTDGQFTMPAAAVTIKATWNTVATCAISFQIGGQEVTTANAPQTAEYTFKQVGAAVNGFTFLGWSETEVAEEVENAPTLITSYTPEAGEESKVLYGIYSRLDDSDANYGKYVKATAVAEGDYLIVCEDQNVAFDGSLTTLEATSNNKAATIADGVLTLDNADNYIFTIAAKTGGYSIKSASNKYIGHSGSGNSLKESANDDFTNTISISEGNVTITCNNMVLKYNKTSNQSRFRYFGSGQESIQLYKKNVGSTVYTSSPVEKVTVTFALNGGEGGCTMMKINKGSEFTICSDVPTLTHKEFTAWNTQANGEGTAYAAGETYTFNSDITLYAQWEDAATYTITYAKGGDDVTGVVPTDANEYYAGDQVTVLGQNNLVKTGYEFQGWLYGNKLYAEDATFVMLTENVTLTAQWRKESVVELVSEKMMLISDASALISGMKVAFGCSYGENSFAMAGEINDSEIMTSVSGDNISLSNGIATFTASVVTMIAEQVEGGWTLRKDETHYLKETAQKKLTWGSSENATIWTFSFSNGNATIASESNVLLFNKQSPRFTTYGGTSQQVVNIQLFGKVIVIASDEEAEPVEVSLSELGYVEEEPIVASGNVTLTIDEPTDAPSVTAKNGATVIIAVETETQSVNVEVGSKIVAEASTTTSVVNFATTLGSSNAPSIGTALGKANNITLPAGGEVHYDLTLGSSLADRPADPTQWHAFTVPFPVDAMNGIYDAETGAKLTNEVNYAIMDYHGDVRANGQYGWKKYRGTLVPGTFYLMTVDGNTTTFRFKMSVATETVLQALNSMAYTAFGGTDPTNSDYGWNGIGNPSWVSVTVGFPVQVLDPYSYEYQTLPEGIVISASTPFFYKAAASNTMIMTESDERAQYAPTRYTEQNEIKDLVVRFGNDVFKDKLYISASEDALNTYENDKDLVKMKMSKTPKVAQIYGSAYGMQLSMANLPLESDQAELPIILYAPATGMYSISAEQREDVTVYLMEGDDIVWNLSMGACEIDLTQGNNTNYSLRVVYTPNNVVTGTDNLNDADGSSFKFVENDQLYIRHNGNTYNVNGTRK